MPTKQYKNLCQISFQHNFFATEECKDLELRPTASCRYWMNKYDLRLMRRPSGGELFFGKTDSQKGPVQLLEEPLKLSFILRLKDPDFISYSNLPFTDANQYIYYFNNLKKPEENTNDNQSDHSRVEMNVRLSKETCVGISDLLPVKPPEFVLEFADDDPQAATPEQINLTLTDELGNQYYVFPNNNTDQDIPPFIQLINGQSPHFQIELRSLPSGSYQLWREDDPVLSFFSQNEGMRAGDLGIIDIYLGEGKGQPIPRDDKRIQAQYHYHLNFERRETVWRYHIIDQSGVGFSGLQITNEKNITLPEADQPLFVMDEDKVFSNGVIAKVMVSTVNIPLKEVYDFQFKLHYTGKRNGRETRIINLPYADANRISYQPNPEGENILYSDIFVYV